MSADLVARLQKMAWATKPSQDTLRTQSIVKETPETMDDIAILLTEAAKEIERLRIVAGAVARDDVDFERLEKGN